MKNYITLIIASLVITSVSSAQQDTNIKGMVDSLMYTKNDSAFGYSSIFWRIVQQKKLAIPYLIDKLNDTAITLVTYECKKSNLNVGDIAYFALDQIGDFPASTVMQSQFDVYSGNCWSFYYWLFDNYNKPECKKKVSEFYSTSQFKWVVIPEKERSKAQKKYHITGHYEWIEK